jgi:hypothetical protein
MKKLSVLIYLSICCSFACNNDDDFNIDPNDLVSENCDINAIENTSLYNSNNEFPYNIESVSLTSKCLLINIRYSGCIENIEALLVDEGSILESFPVQRNIKLVVTTEVTECEPLFYKSFSFDLKPLQVAYENQISFNLEGYNQAVLYTY